MLDPVDGGKGGGGAGSANTPSEVVLVVVALGVTELVAGGDGSVLFLGVGEV